MFYSHQLLARKAPLGQIWMAATLHSKINRKRLAELDIIEICEEILNPSVPMALRLSGILMGGVVIVYEKKVKLLYGKLLPLSFLAEIIGAWRVKPSTDPTVLPKGKAQAKYEAVTLPEKIMNMYVEQPMIFSEVDAARFQGMSLDDLDEHYVNVNLDDDFSRAEHAHQAEAVNITLVDNFESGLAETDVFNRFERFDIADDETTVNITPDEGPQVPSMLFPSPPRQEDPPQQGQYYAAPSPVPSTPVPSSPRQEDPPQQGQYYAVPSPVHEEHQQGGSREEQEEQKMENFNFIRTTKISNLMDMPPVALISYSEKSSSELYYPKPLMQLWKECTEVNSAKASSSGQPSSSQEQQPRKSPPWEFPPQPEGEYQMETGANLMDFPDGFEKLRANVSTEYDAYNTLHSDHSVTPGSPGLSRRSASSSDGSGRGFLSSDQEMQLASGSGRSKRKQHSSGRSLGNLDPVEEDFPLEQEVRDFKMRRLSDFEPTPDLVEETEPTQTPQTPYEKRSDPIDKVTESIQSYLKQHFDTPGSPQSESLSLLASGMTSASAARLFYQTTVLATFNFIKVSQLEPYGDILISRGAKM
nr:unnamed protein product [Digitaria exilis]